MNNYITPPTKDLWVFGYGSLMWQPGFAYSESAMARVYGYHRKLCLQSIHYRGTKEKPGLVAGLAPGGSCVGMIFKVVDSEIVKTIDYLIEREMVSYAYSPVFINAYPTQKTCKRALTFVSLTDHPQYAANLSLEQTIDIVSTARGKRGSNAEYIRNTLAHLEQLGIVDNNLRKICRRL